MKFRQITFKENQVRAHKILKAHGISKEHNIPIDPELILRNMGISVVPYPGLRFKFGALGFVTKINSDYQVWIDEYHYHEQPDSSLLTVGEELGHITLHLKKTDDVSSITEWIETVVANEEYYRFIEQQAKTFASNIILPNFIFDPYVVKWVGDNLESLKDSKSPNREELADEIASIMARDLRISEYIIEITLKRWPNPAIFQIMRAYPDLIYGTSHPGK